MNRVLKAKNVRGRYVLFTSCKQCKKKMHIELEKKKYETGERFVFDSKCNNCNTVNTFTVQK